jgi:hypothetical protein
MRRGWPELMFRMTRWDGCTQRSVGDALGLLLPGVIRLAYPKTGSDLNGAWWRHWDAGKAPRCLQTGREGYSRFSFWYEQRWREISSRWSFPVCGVCGRLMGQTRFSPGRFRSARKFDYRDGVRTFPVSPILISAGMSDDCCCDLAGYEFFDLGYEVGGLPVVGGVPGGYFAVFANDDG